MDLKVIVMITMLALPNGESTVHVTSFESPSKCIEAADIEASDPFVANVECAQIDDGVLMLKFTPKGGGAAGGVAKPPAAKATS